MKYLIFFIIIFSTFGSSDEVYHKDYLYRYASMHPTKYVVFLYSDSKNGQEEKDSKSIIDESLKRVKADIEKIQIYASPNFEKEIGFLKEDGLYLNNKKICRKNDLGLLLGLKTFEKIRWPYCREAGVYYSGRESWNMFFLAEKVTGKSVEIGVGENKYFIKRGQIPAIEDIFKPTFETVKETVTEFDKFEKLRKEVCKLFKSGTSEQLIDYMNKNKVKHNLEKGGALKKGIVFADRYRKDLEQVCNYSNLWLVKRYNAEKNRVKLNIKSKSIGYKYSEGGSGIGYLYFHFKPESGWRLTSVKYPIRALDKDISLSPDGTVKYKK
tara:strand:+ start:142228 stop:143202 length:975 start_codon:yes stop_codon:yes gene_type:complete